MVCNMTRRNLALIPVFAAVALIPQLLFWWLAPLSAAAWVPVYLGGTFLTAGIPAVCLVAYWKSDLRRTAGLWVVCCILEIAATALCALLLGLDVPVRSAVFIFLIAVLLCLIILIPLTGCALHTQPQGVYPLDLPVEPVRRLPPDPEAPQTAKPLPPRNR